MPSLLGVYARSRCVLGVEDLKVKDTNAGIREPQANETILVEKIRRLNGIDSELYEVCEPSCLGKSHGAVHGTEKKP